MKSVLITLFAIVAALSPSLSHAQARDADIAGRWRGTYSRIVYNGCGVSVDTMNFRHTIRTGGEPVQLITMRDENNLAYGAFWGYHGKDRNGSWANLVSDRQTLTNGSKIRYAQLYKNAKNNKANVLATIIITAPNGRECYTQLEGVARR